MRVVPNDLDSFILKIKFERASAEKRPIFKIVARKNIKQENK